MDLEQLTKQLPALEAEVAELRKQEQEVAAKADNLDRIIQGIRGLTAPPPVYVQVPMISRTGPTPARSDNGTSLRGIAAVRAVMLERPERTWRARDVHIELERREWVSPEAQHPMRGTEAAIHRLLKRGELEKRDRGLYKVTDKMRRSDED